MFGMKSRRSQNTETVAAEVERSDPLVDALWTDDALDSDDGDDLDRKRFADMVAARMDACVPGQKSTVFGLVGPWGSGKTSLINMVRKRLGDDWKIAVFSPWASDTAAGLQFEFLAAVASLLDGEDEKSRKARESLRKYATVCAPLLKAIPYAGAGLGGAAEKALELSNPPWHRQFEDVSKVLASLGSRVLLIADDVDRLDADELLSLLKVVRLLGRFPNVHYLIAYDQATVVSLLRGKNLASRSTEFMEKIVQYPFEVPPIAGVIQRRLLTQTIIELIEAHKVRLNPTHSDRLSEYTEILGHALVTPRAHARFREQLSAYAAMFPLQEVDIVDFIALSFLRVFFHNIYDRIPTWKTSLQTGKERVGLLEEAEIDQKEWFNRIRSSVDTDEDAALVQQVLSGLFPGIKSNKMYFKEHKKALSDDAYFQRYFVFGIAEDDVEDQLIEAAVDSIIMGSEAVDDVKRYLDIVDGSNNQRAALAYEKSLTYRSGHLVEPSKNLALFLFERKCKSSEDEPAFDSAQRVLWRWLEAEVFNALSVGVLGASDVLGSLEPKDVLHLVVRILRDRRHTEYQSGVALQELGRYYYRRLTTDLVGLLDSGLDLNTLVSVVVFLSDKENFYSIGDKLLNADSASLLSRVVPAMVTVNKWQGKDGVSPELAFNGDTLFQLFSNEATIRLAASFPDAPWLSQINKEDTSPNNRVDFARASIRSIAEGIPRG
ncbi:hypothetical protein A5740_26040 [Mycobacterium sp. GA-1841]|nr:hypothetical protein A5740_26040 [Mycobacterium sp. GA-1841]